MPKPTEHKSVQARILKYAQDIGWSFIPQPEAESRRGFASTTLSDPDEAQSERNNYPLAERSRSQREKAKNASRCCGQFVSMRVFRATTSKKPIPSRP